MARILLAAPHASLCDAFAGVLRNEGHEPVVCHQGREVLTLLERDQPAVAVLTTDLAEPSGLMLIELLHQAPWANKIRLVLAGPELWDGGEAATQMREARADALLALPCRRSTFLSVIRRQLPPPAAAQLENRIPARELVEELVQGLDRASYYDLLGLSRDANPERIRAYFLRRSLLLHPDRHQAAQGTPFFDKVVLIYKRLNEAYSVLANPARRQQYDEGLAQGQLRLLETGGKVRGKDQAELGIRDLSARKFYRMGREALDAGNAKAARMHLQLALSREPGNKIIAELLGSLDTKPAPGASPAAPLRGAARTEAPPAPEPLAAAPGLSPRATAALPPEEPLAPAAALAGPGLAAPVTLAPVTPAPAAAATPGGATAPAPPAEPEVMAVVPPVPAPNGVAATLAPPARDPAPAALPPLSIGVAADAPAPSGRGGAPLTLQPAGARSGPPGQRLGSDPGVAAAARGTSPAPTSARPASGPAGPAGTPGGTVRSLTPSLGLAAGRTLTPAQGVDAANARHLVIIAGGCAAWAQERGTSIWEALRRSMDALRSVVELCLARDFTHLTLRALPDEGEAEPGALLDALLDTILTERAPLLASGVRLELSGAVAKLPAARVERLEQLVAELQGGSRLVLHLLVSRDSRQSIVQAVRSLSEAIRTGRVSPERIDEQAISAAMPRCFGPPPTLMIYAAGPWLPTDLCAWQAARSVRYHASWLWPDFSRTSLEAVLDQFAVRQKE